MAQLLLYTYTYRHRIYWFSSCSPEARLHKPAGFCRQNCIGCFRDVSDIADKMDALRQRLKIDFDIVWTWTAVWIRFLIKPNRVLLCNTRHNRYSQRLTTPKNYRGRDLCYQIVASSKRMSTWRVQRNRLGHRSKCLAVLWYQAVIVGPRSWRDWQTFILFRKSGWLFQVSGNARYCRVIL